MKVEPGGIELLRVARDTLLRKLLPALAPQYHYDARMVANAMAIAARELEAAAGDAAGECARLARLMPDWQAPADAQAALREGNARLAQRIRAGAFDSAAAQRELAAHLEAVTRARLAISNPKRK